MFCDNFKAKTRMIYMIFVNVNLNPFTKNAQKRSQYTLNMSTKLIREVIWVIGERNYIENFKALSLMQRKHLIILSFPSVCRHVSARLPLEGFLCNLTLETSGYKIQIWLKSDKISGTLYEDRNSLLLQAT